MKSEGGAGGWPLFEDGDCGDLLAGSLKVFLEGSGVLNRYEYSFYIDGPPPGPLLYCTQEQYSS